MKGYIKLFIAVLCVLIITFSVCRACPQYDESSDLYEVSGVCIDVYRKKITGTFNDIMYLVMNDGTSYRLDRDIWDYIDKEEDSIIGTYISFSIANDTVVRWDKSEESKTKSLKMVNRGNLFAVIVCVIVSIAGAFLFMLREICLLGQKRYQKIMDQIAAEKRAKRKEKQRAKREYFNQLNQNPNVRKNRKKK